MQQTNLIATISLWSKTGDLTKDTMGHCKDSTSWRQWKSMERNKCRFGDVAMIFPHHHSISTTKDTPRMIGDIRILNQRSYL